MGLRIMMRGFVVQGKGTTLKSQTELRRQYRDPEPQVPEAKSSANPKDVKPKLPTSLKPPQNG